MTLPGPPPPAPKDDNEMINAPGKYTVKAEPESVTIVWRLRREGDSRRRHCERSEAIQGAPAPGLTPGLLRRKGSSQ